ncbi:hypothetical protein RvY_04114 [Ramazzottius varieornatus]|uniref:Uncharacterized protein n=1 Tax=Ramazzottius varieornatus TaxID=947166 RepID=A0A1D1V0I2_RAMVA|nr:hypothetical protein RvY_04114 [Ramazzottius varieornatus]
MFLTCPIKELWQSGSSNHCSFQFSIFSSFQYLYQHPITSSKKLHSRSFDVQFDGSSFLRIKRRLFPSFENKFRKLSGHKKGNKFGSCRIFNGRGMHFEQRKEVSRNHRNEQPVYFAKIEI